MRNVRLSVDARVPREQVGDRRHESSSRKAARYESAIDNHKGQNSASSLSSEHSQVIPLVLARDEIGSCWAINSYLDARFEDEIKAVRKSAKGYTIAPLVSMNVSTLERCVRSTLCGCFRVTRDSEVKLSQSSVRQCMVRRLIPLLSQENRARDHLISRPFALVNPPRYEPVPAHSWVL
jgi:hypothetical protein